MKILRFIWKKLPPEVREMIGFFMILLTPSVIFIPYFLLGEIEYAVIFFEEIYMIVFITLFGFLLVTARGLMTTINTLKERADIYERLGGSERELSTKERKNIMNDSESFHVFLFIIFIFTLFSWTLTMISIQHEAYQYFFAFSFICLSLMIDAVILIIYQMYVTSKLEAKR